MSFTWRNAWVGGLIYAAGDSIATLISDEFLWQRLVGMLLLGGTLLAWEIPNYFDFIQQHFKSTSFKSAIRRMLAASLYFNPLWIARHLCFIKIFSGQWQLISADIWGLASHSFIYGLPFSLLANYIIQNFIALKWRFTASSLFSACMVIYYALSEVIFATI